MLFRHSIEIAAEPAALFDLSQDYDRRLAWDPLLGEARLLGGAEGPGLGGRAVCGPPRPGHGDEVRHLQPAGGLRCRDEQGAVALPLLLGVVAVRAGRAGPDRSGPGRTGPGRAGAAASYSALAASRTPATTASTTTKTTYPSSTGSVGTTRSAAPTATTGTVSPA